MFEICAAEAGAVAAEDGQRLKEQCNNSVQPQRRSKTLLHMSFSLDSRSMH